MENNKTTSQKVRKKQILVKSIAPKEFKMLIEQVPEKDKISRVAFLLSYGSGLRISEVVGNEGKNNIIPPLNKDNFDMNLEPPQVKVYGKYSKERIVPVPKGWRDWMFSILPIKKSARTLERKFKKYSKKAKLNPLYTYHSLRHGFATRLVDAGVPITHIQYLLGHGNVSTTNVYVRARPKDALKSYEELF